MRCSSATTLPRSMTTTRSATRKAARTFCSTSSTASPRSSRRWARAATISPTTFGASPRLGSSRTMTDGSAMSARARQHRCSPPESAPAGRLIRSARRGKSSRAAARRAAYPLSRIRTHPPRARLSSTVSDGKTSRFSGTCVSPRAAICSAPSRVTSSPPSVTVPAVGRSSPETDRRSVDLPAPLAPTTATSSPGSTVTVTSWSTSRRSYAARSPSTRRPPAAWVGFCAVPAGFGAVLMPSPRPRPALPPVGQGSSSAATPR